MTTVINASPSNGLVQSADGSGILKVQSNGVTTNALAWVNFNGTGTVAIRSAYNVSSITDNGTGDYTVNFTTALADANYSAVGKGMVSTAQGGFMFLPYGAVPSVSSIRVFTTSSVFSAIDCEYNSVQIFGN